ncbi:MAG: hypothetical protein NXI19_03610 [Alphaproteobacteria bacterium]|nr:hypothetical protein [Alphaproteobacteria bacterium]
MKLRGRRDRSPDGERRTSRVHRFRDLEPATDLRIRALAKHFDVPLGSVVDAAIAAFFTQVMERAELGTGAETHAAPAGRAGSRAEIETLAAWTQMRDAARHAPDASPPAAGLSDLEADLAARRAKLTDDLTRIGRQHPGSGQKKAPEGED